ncbi:MAG: zinc-ribbon domain-containing protein [Clostridia bacterium]|nr:zinc-ribbon domain-containing protein [Clostridia bacterium]
MLLIWEKEAKSHFNLCHKCGKWVDSIMYNADVLNCVECSAWENKPHYCLNCGVEASISDKFCSKCGTKLQYGEVDKI